MDLEARLRIAEARAERLERMNQSQALRIDRQSIQIAKLRTKRGCNDCHYKLRCEEYSKAAISAVPQAGGTRTKTRW